MKEFPRETPMGVENVKELLGIGFEVMVMGTKGSESKELADNKTLEDR